MSQHEVFIILKELGGEATAKDISAIAKKRFPNSTLHSYVLNRLHKLEKWGYVKEIQTPTDSSWKIVKEFDK